MNTPTIEEVKQRIRKQKADTPDRHRAIKQVLFEKAAGIRKRPLPENALAWAVQIACTVYSEVDKE